MNRWYSSLEQPLRLIPEYRDYVWGGQRLRPGQRTAEAWVVYADDRVASGPWAGESLAGLAEAYGAELLGERAVRSTGTRFPLLIKLLDCAQWLSLQVHPDDERAVQLEGPGHVGKTEAWHVLEAEPGAQLIAGMRPAAADAAAAGADPEGLAWAIRDGTILDWVQYHAVAGGDTFFMPARTIHALGPGILAYEVQQTSDITYRVYDWGRPATPGRVLHIEKSLAVVDPCASASGRPAPALRDGERASLVACPYFTLELIATRARPVMLRTGRQTFHALTVIEGAAEIVTAAGAMPLARFESAVVPAACDRYELRAAGPCRVLKAGVEAPRA